MAAQKTNPHIDQPTEAELQALIAGAPPALQTLYLELHRLVLETVPDVKYSVDCKDRQIGYGAHQYGYNGWGMAAVAPYTKWVSLGFLSGAALDDPEGLLEGSGAAVRHVKFRSPEELSARREAVQRLLRGAVRVNQAS